MMRSAWLKWARSVEHQKLLAWEVREFRNVSSYEYARTDNERDYNDPLLRVHWQLRVKKPYPERWSVLIGDVLTNLRAALDHAFWQAVAQHAGLPEQPHRVTFPIAPTAQKFKGPTKDLAPLVSSKVWEIVEAVQPFHGGNLAHTAPLEVLRWLSNLDKHRAVHVVGRINVDMGPVFISASQRLDVIEDWRLNGIAEDGTVVARLKLKRSAGDQSISLQPTFAHIESVQICDEPEPEFRSLGSAMEVMRDGVLSVLTELSDALGVTTPSPHSLYLGEEHDEVAC
jgi:hypothetical protein